MAKYPKTIYLQRGIDEITWCRDRQNDDDVEYIAKAAYDAVINKRNNNAGVIVEDNLREIIADNQRLRDETEDALRARIAELETVINKYLDSEDRPTMIYELKSVVKKEG